MSTLRRRYGRASSGTLRWLPTADRGLRVEGRRWIGSGKQILVAASIYYEGDSWVIEDHQDSPHGRWWLFLDSPARGRDYLGGYDELRKAKRRAQIREDSKASLVAYRRAIP